MKKKLKLMVKIKKNKMQMIMMSKKMKILMMKIKKRMMMKMRVMMRGGALCLVHVLRSAALLSVTLRFGARSRSSSSAARTDSASFGP